MVAAFGIGRATYVLKGQRTERLLLKFQDDLKRRR